MQLAWLRRGQAIAALPPRMSDVREIMPGWAPSAQGRRGAGMRGRPSAAAEQASAQACAGAHRQCKRPLEPHRVGAATLTCGYPDLLQAPGGARGPHPRDGRRDERREHAQVLRERARGGLDHVLAQEDARQPLRVLAGAHAAVRGVLARQVRAHGVLQRVLGARRVARPARAARALTPRCRVLLTLCRLAPHAGALAPSAGPLRSTKHCGSTAA